MKGVRSIGVGILLVVAVAGGVALGAGALGNFFPSMFGAGHSFTDRQVVMAVQKEEQVVLVSLAKEGLAHDDKNGKFLGMNIPGADRVKYLQYSYRAKLGVDGRQVRAEKTADHLYKVTVPDFAFIGHSDEKFETAIEDGGVLKFAAPDIDSAKLVSQVLSADAQAKDVEQQRPLLEQQARTFYSSIIQGVDPEAKIDFVFTG